MTNPPANGFHHENIEELLGGYATGTLTAPEREALFQAALHNQALFDALADEEALRELLEDPASRQRLLDAIRPAPQPRWSRLAAWFSRPRSLALAGSLATALLVVVGVRHQSEQARQTAAVSEPAVAKQVPPVPEAAPRAPASSAPEAEASSPRLKRESAQFSAEGRKRAGDVSSSAPKPAPKSAIASPPAGSRDEKAAAQPQPDSGRLTAPAAEVAKKQAAPEELAKNNYLRDAVPAPATPPGAPAAGGPAPARQAAAEAVLVQSSAPKLKVAVVGSQSGNEQRQVELLLARKLDSTGNYSVIDSNEVERVRESRKLQNKPIDAVTAASIGRSVGADTVIVADLESTSGAGGQARAKTAQSAGALGGAPPAGYRLGAASPRKEADAQQNTREDKDVRQEPPLIVAQAIDSRTAQNVGAARAQNPAALGDSVDQVASQLNTQLNRRQNQVQNFAPPFEGLVTDVNPAGTVIDLGSRAGVRPGDRLEVRRNGQVLGVLSITRAEPAFSVGTYLGDTPVQAGDRVLKR